MADYGITTIVHADYTATVERTRAALAEQGFGVLTEIDVAATMKAKLDIDLPPHLILGACNPPLAHRAITAEPSIGLLLPCNVIIREDTENPATIHVEAMDPQLMVQVVDDPALATVADQAAEKLRNAISTLAGELR